jgi:AraC family transcriptional activator FtrA
MAVMAALRCGVDAGKGAASVLTAPFGWKTLFDVFEPMRPPLLNPVIAVLVFDRISAFHLSVPSLIFGEDRTQLGLPRFDMRVCAMDNRDITMEGGLRLSVPYGLEALDDADIVIVPSWRDVEERPPEAALAALRSTSERGALMVGLCLGSFVLAAAGLLDGRRAATHWAFADQLAALYPAVRVEADPLYIDEGDILTSAGVVAGLDACLHLVRRLYGAEKASRLARRIVIPPHRQGGQAQFIETPISARPEPDRFARVIDEVRARLNEPHKIEDVAQRAAMSARTFTRHFAKATGLGFHEWLIEERLRLAQRLLETTHLSIEEIATRSGFGAAVSLRQRFAAQFGLPPAQYRKSFDGRENDDGRWAIPA